jgi:hypothetical protein
MMKSVALMISATAACTSAPTESSATSAATVVDAGGSGMSTEGWNMDLKPDSKEDALWPSTVHTAQIIYRPGPDKHGVAASLAFVVWDHTTVAHVYWVELGDPDADLHTSWAAVVAKNTSADVGHVDYWFVGNGAGAGGAPPVPRPNVDNSFIISSLWLTNAKTAALADYNFGQYADPAQ